MESEPGVPPTGADLVKVGLDTLSEPVKRFTGTLVGAPTSELGELWAAKVRMRRLAYELKALERAQEMVEQSGRDPKKVAWGKLFPLLEGAANEDDPSLAERWAALIANAAVDPDDASPRYAGVLSQLGPRDALMADAIFEASNVDGRPAWHDFDLDAREIATKHGIEAGLAEVVMDNLFRLRLCKGLTGMPSGEVNEMAHMRLTRFGHDFVLACRPPKPAQG